MHHRLVAMSVGLVVPAVFVQGVGQGEERARQTLDWPTARVKHAGLATDMTLGTSCFKGPRDGAGICVDDFDPPRIHAHLPLDPGGRLRIRTKVQPDLLQLRLAVTRKLRVTWQRSLKIRQVGPRRFVARLPADLGPATRLNLYMEWRNAEDGVGDADFWTGVRRDC